MAICEGAQSRIQPQTLGDFVTVGNQKKERSTARVARIVAVKPSIGNSLPLVPRAENHALRQSTRVVRQKNPPQSTNTRPIQQQLSNSNNSRSIHHNSSSSRFTGGSNKSSLSKDTSQASEKQDNSVSVAVIRPAAWSKVLNLTTDALKAKNIAKQAPKIPVPTISTEIAPQSSIQNAVLDPSLHQTSKVLSVAEEPACNNNSLHNDKSPSVITPVIMQEDSKNLDRYCFSHQNDAETPAAALSMTQASLPTKKKIDFVPLPTPKTNDNTTASKFETQASRSGDSKFTSPITQKPPTLSIAVEPNTSSITAGIECITPKPVANAKNQKISSSPSSVSRKGKKIWAPLQIEFAENIQRKSNNNRQLNTKSSARFTTRGNSQAAVPVIATSLPLSSTDHSQSQGSADASGSSIEITPVAGNTNFVSRGSTSSNSNKSCQTLSHSKVGLNSNGAASNWQDSCKFQQNAPPMANCATTGALKPNEKVNLSSELGSQKNSNGNSRYNGHSQRRQRESNIQHGIFTNHPVLSVAESEISQFTQPLGYYANGCYYVHAQNIYLPPIQPEGYKSDATSDQFSFLYPTSIGHYPQFQNNDITLSSNNLEMMKNTQANQIIPLNSSVKSIQYFPAHAYLHPYFSQSVNTLHDLQQAIRKQVEFYFSFENLIHDFYLRKHMNSNGWVPLSIVIDFPRMRPMAQNNIELVIQSLKESTSIEIDDEKLNLRPVKEWETLVNLPLISDPKKVINNNQHNAEKKSGQVEEAISTLTF